MIDSVSMLLASPLTHPDWMMRDAVPGVVWGIDGVKHMLDACKSHGWSRIYWRVLDGGRSLYRSRLVTPGEHWEFDAFHNPQTPEDKRLLAEYGMDVAKPLVRRKMLANMAKVQAMDYSTFDSLAAAVSYGHEIGLQVHAWITINEDDHAWGLRSDFSLKYPELRWRKRDGRYYHSQISFAFPEAMSYKVGIVKEIVDRYDIDGLFFDWLRTGDIRDNPQTDPDGVADHGYEEPLVQGFRARYGVDPHDIPNGDDRWVRFRSEPHTEFARRVRNMVRSTKPHLMISMMGAHPWCYRGAQDRIDGNLRGLLLDVATWAQEGLIDDVVAGGYYMEGGTPERAYEALKRETENRANVWLYCWVPRKVEDFERDYALARKLGAEQILFWEADYIDDRTNEEGVLSSYRTRHGRKTDRVDMRSAKEELRQLMRSRSRECAHGEPTE